ncbi:hypothetical protein Lal_00013820 [Lupinus albus]|nr:hypothetical protein Lal_00013820 [Lupinus albus]
MWFNSKQRAEPYQPLTCPLWSSEMASFSSAGWNTGAAWLSSARVVRCWVKSRNERNPYLGHSGGTAGDKPEEGGDDVKSSWPLWVGLHTCYNGGDSGTRSREMEQIPKSRLSSDCTLQLECMKLESLVIADQHAAVNTFPGLVHTARHTMGVGFTRRWCANPRPRRSGTFKSRWRISAAAGASLLTVLDAVPSGPRTG